MAFAGCKGCLASSLDHALVEPRLALKLSTAFRRAAVLHGPRHLLISQAHKAYVNHPDGQAGRNTLFHV